MSASRRATRWPCWRRARARLAATVDLPTPPLPLATATTDPTPGKAIFCGPAPCGCISYLHLSSLFVRGGLDRPAVRALAQLPEMFQGENSCVVAVAPGDFIGVVTDRRHRHHGQRHQLIRFEDAKRVGRLQSFFAAAGARAVVAQVLPGVTAAVAVLPLDHE